MISPYLKSRLFWLLLKFWAAAFCSEQDSLPRNGTERNSDSFLYLFPRNGIPSCFLFRWKVRKGILRVWRRHTPACPNKEIGCCSYDASTRVCFYFCFHGTEFRVVFSSAEGFGTEFRGFLFRGTAGIPSEITICSVYSVFRGIIFLSEIPNPTPTDIKLNLSLRIFDQNKKISDSKTLLYALSNGQKTSHATVPFEQQSVKRVCSRIVHCIYNLLYIFAPAWIKYLYALSKLWPLIYSRESTFQKCKMI